MKLARYVGGGHIAIVDEPAPACPAGGLLIKTEASGLCSGELMDWYMERKVPHVLGHEVSGRVIESDDERFPVGSRVFPHHHAPCLQCEFCLKDLHVHCAQWKRTKLDPGGMAEVFAVSAENLTDTLITDGMRPADAALIEPVACVVKGFRAAGADPARPVPGAVIGLGAMGLIHALLLENAVGYDLNPARVEWARGLGIDARNPVDFEPASLIFVCPGNEVALKMALDMAAPGATVVLFAPMPPGTATSLDLNRIYFRDVKLVNSYSCGPQDTLHARSLLLSGRIKAEQVVSDFIAIDDLPRAYQQMKRGEILKPMVMFDS